MQRYICILLILFWAVSVFAEDLPDSVFPWGAYSNYRSSESERDEMRDTLGFNFINLAWERDPDHIIDFMNDGFFVYPNQGPIINGDTINYFKFAEAHYSMIYANDDSSQVRFHERNSYGSDPLYGFFPCDSIAVNETLLVLGNLWIKQEDENGVLIQKPIDYNRAISMRIDTDGVSANDTVAFLVTLNWDLDTLLQVIDTIFITAGQFSDEVPDTLTFAYYNRGANFYTGFEIYSTCKTEVYFEFLKIYCDYGQDLIDDREYDTEIMQSAATLFGGKNVAGWYMSEEPVYDNFRPMAYIDTLIMVASTSFADTARVITAWCISVGKVTRDFINITDPEIVWTDIYPYYGGQTCEDTCINKISSVRTTDYTGYYFTQDRHWGEQFALNVSLQTDADSVNQACRDASKEWWLFPQAFGYKFLTDSCDTCDNKWWWRLPTKSELKCNVFMGICLGARGIIFWKYHGGDYDALYAPGLVYPEGDSVTPGWYAVKEMAPYIEAIGQTLRELEWEAAFSCSSSSQTFSGYVNSVSGYSESTNPDLGWFQVGEFTDGSDPYILVVNRACNVDSVTLAPDVNCVVHLNPSEIGSDYVYIIDPADSVYFDTSLSSWVGIPDTTYTAKMPDGTIPFTTVLGPGEGRLFKIVQSR